MIHKLKDIEKYLFNLAVESNIDSPSVVYGKHDDNYTFYFKMSQRETDDPVVNSFYVKVKDVFSSVEFVVNPVGDGLLMGTINGITITTTEEQMEKFISTRYFDSIVGINKFNL